MSFYITYWDKLLVRVFLQYLNSKLNASYVAYVVKRAFSLLSLAFECTDFSAIAQSMAHNLYHRCNIPLKALNK